MRRKEKGKEISLKRVQNNNAMQFNTFVSEVNLSVQCSGDFSRG